MIVAVHVTVAAFLQGDAQRVGAGPLVVQAVVFDIRAPSTDEIRERNKERRKRSGVRAVNRNDSRAAVSTRSTQDKPEGVHVEPMAPLFVDDAEAGASGRVLAIAGTPAYRHLVVREGDAHLAVEAIVAVSGRVSVHPNRLRLRLRLRAARRGHRLHRKRHVALQKGGERVAVARRRRRPVVRRRGRQIRLVVRHRGRERLAGCNVLPRQLARRRLQVLLNDLEFFWLCERKNEREARDARDQSRPSGERKRAFPLVILFRCTPYLPAA